MFSSHKQPNGNGQQDQLPATPPEPPHNRPKDTPAMSTPTTAPEAPQAAARRPLDYYTLGASIAEAATFEQIAELLLGLQDGIENTGDVAGLIYAVIRCEADDRGVDFTNLTAGLSQDKGE